MTTSSPAHCCLRPTAFAILSLLVWAGPATAADPLPSATFTEVIYASASGQSTSGTNQYLPERLVYRYLTPGNTFSARSTVAAPWSG